MSHDAASGFVEPAEMDYTILTPKSCSSSAKYTLINENTENSKDGQTHLCATTGRRRKSSSSIGGGTLSSRSTRSETKELRSALQDRETVIQNLRIQLCLGKLPRPSVAPLDDADKPAAEQKMQKLKTESENKKIKIKNLKGALEKLDITDNIDIRIRQAELEYALGREELQLLSIVEEARALQARLDKSKVEPQSIYNVLNTGVTFNLHAVHATTGRWAAQEIPESSGVFYVEWALEGDGLYKGDRILEINGKLLTCKTKEEFQKLVGNTGKCQMVILRKKPAAIPQKQLDQEKENNMRLQHRISYLEEQVKELQNIKQEQVLKQLQQQQQQQQHQQQQQNQISGHITSINISSPPTTPPDNKPLVFQRGNYITTLVGGKPIELVGEETPQQEAKRHQHMLLNKSKSSAHITKTLIRESARCDLNSALNNKSLSASKISVNSESGFLSSQAKKDKERQRDNRERERERYEKSNKNQLPNARSVEHLNHQNGHLERRRDTPRSTDVQTLKARFFNTDKRSVKSLDFDSENESIRTKSRLQASDTMSEVRTVRPTPPKKPLRLSLQRAQSLQTVEITASSSDTDRKRPLKRAHINEKLKHNIDECQKESEYILMDNCIPGAVQQQQPAEQRRQSLSVSLSPTPSPPMHTTSSLGRHRQNL